MPYAANIVIGTPWVVGLGLGRAHNHRPSFNLLSSSTYIPRLLRLTPAAGWLAGLNLR